MVAKLVKITTNLKKVKSTLNTIDITLDMIKSIDEIKYPTNITKEYYEVIRELISIILFLDCYKTYGEGVHKLLIEYLKKNYPNLNSFEVSLIKELRVKRNKISYDGLVISPDYLARNKTHILKIISKLKSIIKEKLN